MTTASSAHSAVGSITSVEQLEELLSDPTEAAIRAMGQIGGDMLILGVAGKMGPTLARMAIRASEAAGVKRRVIGVSRFSNPEEQSKLQSLGAETIKADLLDQSQLDRLPDAPNIVYMAGMKFGSTGNESLTWAMNTYLPGMVSQRYRRSRIVAFSTGNVYGLVPASGRGSVETDRLNPVGEYAMSCLGRERIFEHFSRSLSIPMAIIRLNYASELRYGVLVDLATKVWNEQPIDVSMGSFNVIWQADANAMTLASFDRVASPPFVLNVAGPEFQTIRGACEHFAQLMGKPVEFTGKEAGEALLNNGSKGHELYGRPRVDVDRQMRWVADWVMHGGRLLNKPTHFESRDGKF
jgi:hypothetical protein